MKKLFILCTTISVLVLTGCNGWKDDLNRLDDKYSKLYEELNNRLKAVESQVSYINTLLLDLQSRKYVTDMSQQGNLLVITYSNGSPTVIDLSSFKSEIGIALKDGIYCWTITSNGTTTFITDGQGNPIPCTGAAGATGQTGATGANGNDGHTPYIGYNGNWWINGVDTNVPSSITPQIINGYWWINGVNTGIQASGQSAYELAVQQGFTGTLNEWLNSLKATPPTFKFDDEGYWMVNYGNGWVYILDGQGNKVSAKAESQPTTPVSVTEDADYVYITQANGEIISIPKFKSNVKFELEETSINLPNATYKWVKYTKEHVKEVFVASKPEGWQVKIVADSVFIQAPYFVLRTSEWEGNITFLYTSEQGLTYTASINVTTPIPPLNQIYAIGDMYPHHGTPEGVIWAVNTSDIRMFLWLLPFHYHLQLIMEHYPNKMFLTAMIIAIVALMESLTPTFINYWTFIFPSLGVVQIARRGWYLPGTTELKAIVTTTTVRNVLPYSLPTNCMYYSSTLTVDM